MKTVWVNVALAPSESTGKKHIVGILSAEDIYLHVGMSEIPLYNVHTATSTVKVSNISFRYLLNKGMESEQLKNLFKSQSKRSRSRKANTKK